MKKVLSVLMVLLVLPVVGSAALDAANAGVGGKEEKFGAGVTIKDATPFAELFAAPEKFVGKTIRLDGVVSSVCEDMGCWIAIASETNKDQVVRFKVDHDAKMTFPITARGKKASAEGVFEKIGANDKEGNEAAAEQTAADPKTAAFGKKFQVKALGAIVF
jgi:hypothetical protein